MWKNAFKGSDARKGKRGDSARTERGGLENNPKSSAIGKEVGATRLEIKQGN